MTNANESGGDPDHIRSMRGKYRDSLPSTEEDGQGVRRHWATIGLGGHVGLQVVVLASDFDRVVGERDQAIEEVRDLVELTQGHGKVEGRLTMERDAARRDAAEMEEATRGYHAQLAAMTKERDAVNQERDELVDQLASVTAARAAEDAILYRAMVAMGNGNEEDRWPPGTHVIDALIAERDALAERVRGMRELLSEARDSVEFEAQENHQNWGDRLMHKQRGAIDLLSRVDACLSEAAP